MSEHHNHQPQNSNTNQNTNFHLIAKARIQMTSAQSDLKHRVNSSNAEFVTRHDSNGIITFVDQRVTSLLGYQPSDMLKKGLDMFLVPQERQLINEQLKTIYETKQSQPVQINLNFLSNPSVNSQQEIPFKTTAYAFCNPCNEAFEFIVCTHVYQKYVSLNRN
jgi:aryl hydrocarbon receptor nuclear translocator 2